jgi:DNA-binding CsgD family transcriptional regulator
VELQDALDWRRGRPWQLLERDAELSELAHAADRAANGEGGRLIFISGEAGIGKSALLRQFVATNPDVEALTGVCEPMGAGEALAPLFDIARDLSHEVFDRLNRVRANTELYAAVVDALRNRGTPSMIAFEDVQWADQGTLDLLRYIGHRVKRLSTLVVATYREEDVDPRSPLTLVLGDLATSPEVQRIDLLPLSEQATSQLAARTGTDPTALHHRTAGNPFFITEILAAGGDRLPTTVRDAVLARVARLAEPTRLALEAAAVVGPRFDQALFEALLDRLELPRWTLRASIFTGMLRQEQPILEFRHALAQTAILESVPPDRLQHLHRAVLDELQRRGPGPDAYTALLLHAEGAGDDAAVQRYAPLAAERAAAFSAHREAAAFFGKALLNPTASDRERAAITERQADELSLGGDHQRALAGYRSAAALWRQEGERVNLARVLVGAAELTFLAGNHAEADEAEAEAMGLLETFGPTPELAQAYESRARHRFMTWQSSEARYWASKAAAIAATLNDDGIELKADVIVAASDLLQGNDEGRRALLGCLGRAQTFGDPDLTARTAFYLAWLPMLRRDYQGVEEACRNGMACAEEHQLDYWRQLLIASWVRFCLDQGRWREAMEGAQSITANPAGAAIARLPSLTAIGRIRARRGEAGSQQALDEARRSALNHLALEAVTGALPARAEAAWLSGDMRQAVAEARAALESGAGLENPWWTGELHCWLARSGVAIISSTTTSEPYALELNGDFEAAALWWDTRGCRYEAAMARASSNRAEAITAAIAALDALGAGASSAWARNRLRTLGVSAVPRGPRPSTSANPARLTQREQEVLELVAQGHSNPAISRQLFLSPKTIERHLSSILTKLDAPSRNEAVDRAREIGALPPGPQAVRSPQ